MNYSFVVPIYNDGYLVNIFCAEFLKIFSSYLSKQDIEKEVELIFVNDGSCDNSLEMLKDAAAHHSFVRVIDLSRNFGQHVAILCGYKHASGKIVGRLNVDMQDPPREIPTVLNALKNSDADIVVGLQKERQSKASDQITSHLFFLVFNWLIGASIPRNTATLRVMQRRYVEAITQAQDKAPFLQGLENWVGFKVKYVQTDHQERSDAKSSYTFVKRLSLALNAAISFSDRPLKIVVSLGFIIGVLGFLSVLAIIVMKLFVPDIRPGFASTLAIILFLAGIQISVTGLCGIYIGKVLLHVQNRPLFIVKELVNFANQPSESTT